MANISLTSAQIKALTDHGAIIRPYTAGGEVTIGYAVYIASDGDVEHSDASLSQAASRAIGVAVESYDGETTVNENDPVSVCVFGPVSGYSGMTPGANLYVSDDAGRIADAAGTYDRIIAHAERASVLFVHPEQNDPSSA